MNYVLVCLVVSFFANTFTFSANNPESRSILLNQLQFPSDNLTKSAATEALYDYTDNTNVQAALINVFENNRGNDLLRQNIALTLSKHSNHPRIKGLLKFYHDQSFSVAFRSIMTRSLYKAIENDRTLQSKLLFNLRPYNGNHIEIQKASVFGLILAQKTNPKAQQVIRQIATQSFTPVELKIEALKVIFHNPNTDKELFYHMASNLYEQEETLMTLIKILKFLPDQERSLRIIQNMIKYSNSTNVKIAAIKSLSLNITDEDKKWLYKSNNPLSLFYQQGF